MTAVVFSNSVHLSIGNHQQSLIVHVYAAHLRIYLLPSIFPYFTFTPLRHTHTYIHSINPSPLPEVALVASNDDGDVLVVPHPVDHLLEAVELVVAPLLCDGIDENEPLPSSHVLLPHSRELVLRKEEIGSVGKGYNNMRDKVLR